MDLPQGVEPLDSEEILYRKIPVSMRWYDVAIAPPLSPQAFGPREDDETGLSLDRAKYRSLAECARGRPGKAYFVAVLRVRDLWARGINVVPAPLPENVGHCELPQITYQIRKSDDVQEKMKILAHELVLRVEGPFQTPP